MNAIVEIIEHEVKNFLLEVYVPLKDSRRIISKEVSDEELQKALDILSRNVDPTWNENEWGLMIIGVTGKYQVYYTLWKYSPKSMVSQLSYMGNLATDIIRAVEKAKRIAGKQPIYFEQYDTLKGLMGAPSDIVPFGKYRGKTLGEVYAEDPQYVIWISKNFQSRNAKQDEFLKIAKEFTDNYFRSMADVNRAAETKKFFGNIGDVFEGDVTINKVDKMTGDLGVSFRFKTETNDNRFQFYIQPKTLAIYFNIPVKYTYTRDGNDVIENISEETMNAINDKANTLMNTQISIKGKVKDHKEIVGKLFTILTRVSLI
jgi:hypothetical protein